MTESEGQTTTTKMTIWNGFCKTPALHTKRFKRRGGFSGTDINPQYRVQKLTETFGPQGFKWGFDIVERWTQSFKDEDYVFIRLNLWYKVGDVLCRTGDQIGGTAADFSPDESYKMAITDALGKCASHLGLGADIYLGQFDGKYSEPAPAPALGVTQTSYSADVLETKIVPFGKHKGRKFAEMDTEELTSYCQWIKSEMAKDPDKPKNKQTEEFLEDARIVFKSRTEKQTKPNRLKDIIESGPDEGDRYEV